MIINFKVNGDTIKTSEKETFYTGNVNSYICEFEFSEDWDKAAAFCVMTNGKKSAVLYIADSKCTVPSEILSGKGTVKLGLYGTDGNKRISTNCVMLKVREGAYEIGEDDMTMPIPDVWEQLVSKTVPKIGDNGNWLVWSMTENKYVDTGIYATVDIGEFYKKSETDKKLSGKVDKVTGKGLSTNDYTDEEKEKLKGLSNYDDTEIKNEIGGKVDKVSGKGLSSNDFTDKEKTAISENTEAISAYHTYLNMVSDLAERNTTDIGKLKESKLDKSEAAGKRVTSDYGEIFNNPNNKAQALAHAENDDTQAIGTGSHAQGYGTITYTEYGDVIGKFNVIDHNKNYAHIVGNGRDDTLRSNAHTLDWDGNTWYKGKIKIGGTSYDDASAEEVATKKYVDSNTSSKEDSANKVTTLDSNSTDTQYPSAKAVYDELVKKANTTDLGLQFVNLGYLSETADFDKLDITYNCYGCFRIRSDIWLNARLNASVSGDFKQGYNGNVLVDTLAPNITVYFIVRQGNTITKGEGSSETTSTQIFYSGDIYLRRITEERGRSIEFEW